MAKMCSFFALESLQLTTANTDSQSGHGGGSPLSGTNEASLSPSGGSTATGMTAGPLSPGAVSQSSHHAGHKGLSTSPAEDVVGGADGPGGLSSAAQDLPARGSCCENGRPIITDPVSGQTVCSCQYDPARLAIGGYSRMALPSGGVGVYGGPYPSNEQNPYPSIGVDNSAFYAPLVRIGGDWLRGLANWLCAVGGSPRKCEATGRADIAMLAVSSLGPLTCNFGDYSTTWG